MREGKAMDVDPWCDEIGRCEAQASARAAGICCCTHCGKQLEFRDGEWWTWDASQYPTPQPQHEDPDA